MKLKFKDHAALEKFLHMNPDCFLTDEDGDVYFKDVDKNMLMFCLVIDVHAMSERAVPLYVSHIHTIRDEEQYKFTLNLSSIDASDVSDVMVHLDDELVGQLAKWNQKKEFNVVSPNIYLITKKKQ